MKPNDIDRFFGDLDHRLNHRIQVVLTGGAAGILLGVERATHDIDFEIHLKPARSRQDAWPAIQRALLESARATDITPQYAEDIDRWSSIILPSKKSRLYRRIGKIEIRLLDPGLWAIGKLARFLSNDVSDLVTVLRMEKPDPAFLARLWGAALGRSPFSTAQSQFQRQVQAFFSSYGKTIWGRSTDTAALIDLFLRSARAAQSRQKRKLK